MALVLTVWYRENFDLLSPLCDRSFTRVGKFSRQIKMMECRIISFFPLTFRTRSFLSSSFSFLFYNNTRLGINSRGRIARCLASFSQTESSQARLKAQFLALFVLLFPPPSLPRYSIWFSVTTVATAVDLSRVHDPCVARRCS